ncbi:hypothetical protein BSLA_03r0195 [Burkholderia stabilis]|nr:hypothetical protein BSLA_03r0195 [Burkholderia stabilis]
MRDAHETTSRVKNRQGRAGNVRHAACERTANGCGKSCAAPWHWRGMARMITVRGFALRELRAGA